MFRTRQRLFLLAIAYLLVVTCLPACTMPAPTANAAPFEPQPELASTSSLPATPTPPHETTPTAIPTFTGTPFQPLATTPAVTPSPMVTATPSATATPAPTSTPAWVMSGPGKVTVPILLYHKIRADSPDQRYNVLPEVFEAQMRLLAAHGYQTISVKQLEDAILHGAMLPPRPFILTFDDGYMDIYDTVYPILSQLDFTGTIYIVANRVKSDGFMKTAVLKELANAGWEIGSHSMSHADLTQTFDNDLRVEILAAKILLEDEVGVDVDTFAYPYGLFSAKVGAKTANYGYTNAVGLGVSIEHDLNTLYYLSRVEIYGTYTIEEFARIVHLDEQLEAH